MEPTDIELRASYAANRIALIKTEIQILLLEHQGINDTCKLINTKITESVIPMAASYLPFEDLTIKWFEITDRYNSQLAAIMKIIKRKGEEVVRIADSFRDDLIESGLVTSEQSEQEKTIWQQVASAMDGDEVLNMELLNDLEN